jgi:hypothetical protein
VAQLESLALENLKIIDDWRNAPIGAILQVTADDGELPFIGMHSIELRSGKLNSYFLVLHGHRSGELLDDDALQRSALDVTEVVDIRVSFPQAVAYQQKHSADFSLVYAPITGSKRFFLRNGEPDKAIFVCLLDPTDTIPVGGLIRDVGDEKLIMIGQIEIVAKNSLEEILDNPPSNSAISNLLKLVGHGL